MSQLVANCPRCGAQHIALVLRSTVDVSHRYTYGGWYEAFCVCRHCVQSSIFLLHVREPKDQKQADSEGLENLKFSVNNVAKIERHVSVLDAEPQPPPEHLPEAIEAAFREGARCVSANCPNAAAAMFRLCLDLTTKPLLPDAETEGLNRRIRRNLGPRLDWLFETGRLPETYRELSSCIKDEGNDGAHDGSLTLEDAMDVKDFAVSLLEHLHTQPAKLKLAKQRRKDRRESGA